MIIGLTGTMASGKSKTSELIKSKGFAHSSLSDRVREEAVARGIKNYTLKQLQEIGNELREQHGNEVLAVMTLKKLEGNDKCVIEGIRNPEEIEELRKRKDFVLIGMDAPKKLRFERIIHRGREGDPKDWKGFLELDKRDFGEEGMDACQQVGKCLKMADVKIDTDSPLEECKKKVEEAIDKLI